MRIALAQINPTVGDLSHNTSLIIDNIKKGKSESADLVVFPELCLTGYPPEDLVLLPHFIQQVEDCIKKIAEHTKGIAAIVGLPRLSKKGSEKHLHISAAILEDGKLIGYQDKMLLPTYDVFDERRFFEPGTEAKLWDIQGHKIAVTICEDIWKFGGLITETNYPFDPVEEYIQQKPDVLINISSSPFSGKKPTVRMEICSKIAKSLNCPVIYCNQVGGNDSLIFDGRSLYVGKRGELQKEGRCFAEDFFLVDTHKSYPSKIMEIDPIADLYQALVLGVRDYFHKQNFSKACLGLSGGIDSALVACVAVDALGKDNVLAVLMPSRYSSQGSVDDSVTLAKALGIDYKVIPIEKPFQTFLELLDPFFEGKESDVTEENMQARIRGLLLMALSNKHGYIVLSTGNKSELAMGYSTLYGDTCGGLNVLGDVTKSQVFAISKWLKIIPEAIIEKPPSAELRPDQKDSDTLPDYEIIDHVVQDYVEKHLSPLKISEKHNYPIEVVSRIVKAIHRNEYKRRQGAPLLRVSEKTFSVGRRFPIVHQWEG